MPFEPGTFQGAQRVDIRRSGGPIEGDHVAIEEPLEICVDGKPVVVTMRTPGHDTELAAGFLFAEGIVTKQEEIVALVAKPGFKEADSTIRVTEFSGDQVQVTLQVTAPTHSVQRATREFRATAACGVCGKSQIDDLASEFPPILPVEANPRLLEALPDILRESQELFELTGGIHGAGIFDLDGNLLCSREDIGRHNAVDKVIGHFLLEGNVPLSSHILVVSGRAGFELVQKALKAAVPVMVSVGAASSLAVQMAIDAGMVLYSFAGQGRGNLYISKGTNNIDDT